MERPVAAVATATISVVDQKSTMNGTGIGNAPEPVGANAGKVAVTTATMDDERVRVVPASEFKHAAASLADSFVDDHVARYFIDTPDAAHWTEAQKWELHASIMEYVTYAHCIKGLVLTVGPNYGAVALWMPPGKNMDDLLIIFRSGMWRLRYKLSAEGRKRFFDEFLPVLHDAKAEVMGPRDDESWYLVYIGTRTEARGKGYARKLIEHVSRMADDEGRACYLESSNDINPKIYQKMGFEIQKKVHLQRADEDIVLDLMVREPVAKGVEPKEWLARFERAW